MLFAFLTYPYPKPKIKYKYGIPLLVLNAMPVQWSGRIIFAIPSYLPIWQLNISERT